MPSVTVKKHLVANTNYPIVNMTKWSDQILLCNLLKITIQVK